MPQIVKVANMFGITIQDLTLPVNLHVSAVRVLYTLIERLQLIEVSININYLIIKLLNDYNFYTILSFFIGIIDIILYNGLIILYFYSIIQQYVFSFLIKRTIFSELFFVYCDSVSYIQILLEKI